MVFSVFAAGIGAFGGNFFDFLFLEDASQMLFAESGCIQGGYMGDESFADTLFHQRFPGFLP